MLRLARLTPNVSDALLADPVEAMAVESLRTLTPVEGFLGMNRSGPRAAFDVKVSPVVDGAYRGSFTASAVSLSAAVGDAIRQAEAAA